MAQSKKIGFPAGMLGEDPMRFDVLAEASPSFVAIGKPADILLDSYLGSPKEKSVMLAMRETPDKPEFKRLGINSPYAVNQLDFEISGAAIIACDKDTANEMRNEIWSGAMKFEYLLLAKSAQASQASFDVDLPVLMHDERPVWLVSHRFGKKAHTVFERLERVGAYELWRASAETVRPHQIRVHANEVGIKIVGELLYSRTPYVYMSDIKEEPYKIGFNQEEQPLYPHIYLHLSKIVLPENRKFDGGKTELCAPLPKGFATTLKRLGFSEIGR